MVAVSISSNVNPCTTSTFNTHTHTHTHTYTHTHTQSYILMYAYIWTKFSQQQTVNEYIYIEECIFRQQVIKPSFAKDGVHCLSFLIWLFLKSLCYFSFVGMYMVKELSHVFCPKCFRPYFWSSSGVVVFWVDSLSFYCLIICSVWIWSSRLERFQRFKTKRWICSDFKTTQHLMTDKSMVESAWAEDMGQFLYHLNLPQNN